MTHDEITKWLSKQVVGNHTIGEDGVVNTQCSVSLFKFKDSVIPVQFGTVDGYFDISITSVTSLSGIPHTICGSFALNGAPIQSLSGIHKKVKLIDGRVICSDYMTHVLGLLLIAGVKSITVSGGPKIEGILNKYLPTRDVISAQDDLIEAGYIKHANL